MNNSNQPGADRQDPHDAEADRLRANRAAYARFTDVCLWTFGVIALLLVLGIVAGAIFELYRGGGWR